jgi:hypothetical protein
VFASWADDKVARRLAMSWHTLHERQPPGPAVDREHNNAVIAAIRRVEKPSIGMNRNFCGIVFPENPCGSAEIF